MNGEALGLSYLKQAAEFLKKKGGKWLCVPNLDFEEETKKIIKGAATIMPAISHGLNDYDDHTGICLLAAFNLTPMHYNMLEAVGIDGIYANRAIAHGIAHQDLMRTALRDPDSKEMVYAVFPDKATAEQQARMFPGCSIGPLGGTVRTVRKSPLTKAECNSKHRNKNNKLLYYKSGELGRNVSKKPKGIGNSLSFRRTANDIGSANPAVPEVIVEFTMTPKVKTKEFASFTSNTIREFIKELYSCSKHNVREEKYDALFNMSKMTGKRRPDVIHSWGFILDFDNGALTPEECSRIFAQYSHCIRNSFSRSKEEPNKFHLIIPSKRNVTPDQHPIIYDYLISMLEDAGYDAKRAGLDLSKRYPESFFFRPVTNKNQPDMAFFLKHRCQTRQLERHCLDPLKVLANLPAEPTQLDPLYYEYEPANDEP